MDTSSVFSFPPVEEGGAGRRGGQGGPEAGRQHSQGLGVGAVGVEGAVNSPGRCWTETHREFPAQQQPTWCEGLSGVCAEGSLLRVTALKGE